MNANEACDNTTDVIQWGIEAYNPQTYKKSKPNLNPWFSKDCKIAHKSEMVAHTNFLQHLTPQVNENIMKAWNNYDRTVNEAKRRINERMQDKTMWGLNESRAFWLLTKHVNNNNNI